MLTLRYIQDNPQEVIEKLAKKRFNAQAIVDKVVALTEEKNQTQLKADNAKAEVNLLSKEIGQYMREVKPQVRASLCLPADDAFFYNEEREDLDRYAERILGWRFDQLRAQAIAHLTRLRGLAGR